LSKGHVVFNYRLKESAEQAIYDNIGDICMSMKAADYLDLPKRIDNEIRVPMPEELARQYKAFEREKVMELVREDNSITAANAAVLCNKLLQFANGAIYDETHTWHELHTLKLEALEEIVEAACGKPLLVAWTFQSDRDRIEKAFKHLKPRRLEKDSDIDDWNAGNIQMLLMHPASGGHGLNLQKGGNLIAWFGQTWSLELEQQFNARLDRQGQTQSVIVHKIVLEGTMDEKVLRAQKDKDAGQQALMAAVKPTIDEVIF
jgi:SNF2 family DNA or RNA helicase